MDKRGIRCALQFLKCARPLLIGNITTQHSQHYMEKQPCFNYSDFTI